MPVAIAERTDVQVIEPTFPDWFVPLLKPARYKSAGGGRSAGKSHQFAQMAVMRMAGLLGHFGYPDAPVRIASCRDFEVSIQESVKIAIEHYIEALGLADEFIVNKFTIDHVNGSHMFFPGVTRKVESFLSVEGVDVFWMEQAEVLQDEMVKIGPSIRKLGSEQWYSWNPHRRTDYVWRRFEMHPQPGDVHVMVTYRDNPWHNETAEAEREAFKAMWPAQYAWAYLGKPLDEDGDDVVLPWAMVEACRTAWDKGLAPALGGLPRTAGLDMAEGGTNNCSLTIAQGPVVQYLDVWPGVVGDNLPAAQRAHEACVEHGVSRLYYDASSAMTGYFRRLGATYQVRGIQFGGGVSIPDMLFEKGRPPKTHADVFRMRNIQMATTLRMRAQNTVRLLRGHDIDPYQCLFFPPDIVSPRCTRVTMDDYLAELTGPIRRIPPGSAKWELDKRGPNDSRVESPDSFDSTCLAKADDTEVAGWRRLRAA